MGGVPNCVTSVSIPLYNERKYPGQVHRVRTVDCNLSCDETYFAPKHMKRDLVAVYDSGIQLISSFMGLAVGQISDTWSLQQVRRTPCSQTGGGLALVQRRILALPGKARKWSGRGSEQLKRLGLLLD